MRPVSLCILTLPSRVGFERSVLRVTFASRSTAKKTLMSRGPIQELRKLHLCNDMTACLENNRLLDAFVVSVLTYPI
jgi:hypothetical protein